MTYGIRLAIATIILFAMNPFSASAGIDNLDSLRWSYRILLIQSPQEGADGLEASLVAEDEKIIDREILWFLFTPDGMRTNYPATPADGFSESVRKRYFPIEDSRVRVLLIGKDGGTKATYSELNLNAVFNRIDSMPMRQAEMREKDS